MPNPNPMTPLPALMVAPNGARLGRDDHPALPVTIPQILQTAQACFAAGATGLHAHVRDADGSHILDAGLYTELLAEMATTLPDMQVQITTEAVGQYAPPQQRALVWDVRPAAVSVSLREMLADGETTEARAFYHDTHAANIAVQHILYDSHDIEQFVALMAAGFLPASPPQVLLVLGRYSDKLEAAPCELPEMLTPLLSLNQTPDWAACAFGRHETACLKLAQSLGGKIRVGFENNTLNADGSVAVDNAARVTELMRP